MSHNTKESENSPNSPHLGEIKRMCKQCVYQALLRSFACAGDEAMYRQAEHIRQHRFYFMATTWQLPSAISHALPNNALNNNYTPQL